MTLSLTSTASLKKNVSPYSKGGNAINPALNQHTVIRDFFYLTKFTSPFGTEHERFGDFFDKLGCKKDKHGNYIIDVGESKTMFASHIDTADRTKQRVRRTVAGDYIGTDGKTILGADNRAGIAVMLHLLRHDIPGRYVFFVGEEAGRIGSTFAEKDGIADAISRVICWDRYGERSIITHQMGERSCSDQFAIALANAYDKQGLTLDPDEGGTYTDSYSFTDVVPECTNISVGYFGQHTTAETQNARFLVDMAEASLEVDWENLPTIRNPFAAPEYNFQPWKYDEEKWYTKQPARSALSIYNDVAELVEAARYNVLTKEEVYDFFWEHPEETSDLLFDLLKGVPF